MVSHVDDDHIQGILDLTREELVEKQARRCRSGAELLAQQLRRHHRQDQRS